jgi:glyceraldehyde 3-phosphate dehydrogenase
MLRIGINGFGRIGRTLMRACQAYSNQIQIVAINDLADASTLMHLLKYDSIHGRFRGDLSLSGTELKVNGQSITLYQQRNPADIPWNQHQVDYVIDCTGLFLTTESLSAHLKDGVKAAILSAPAIDAMPSVVMGVNEFILTGKEQIISNASCTTNSAAPLIKILDDNFGVQSGFITTVHAYTGDQRLVDSPHKDLRRARAAAQSIIPTTTGAAKAVTKIFPHLNGKLGGGGIRVPVPNASLTDITVMVNKSGTTEEINRLFKQAAEGSMKGILEYTEDPVVSTDIIGNSHSTVFDALLTSVLGKMVKVVAWYDNEMGYSNRLLDLVLYHNRKA